MLYVLDMLKGLEVPNMQDKKKDTMSDQEIDYSSFSTRLLNTIEIAKFKNSSSYAWGCWRLFHMLEALETLMVWPHPDTRQVCKTYIYTYV